MEFVDAHDLDEALAALDARAPGAKVLAGGTDVVAQLLRGEIRPDTLVHIGRLGDLSGIERGGRTRLGALTSHWQLAQSEVVRGDHRALAEAALTVGGRQTQNQGTIAGNVVNASPAADCLPALLVADAEAEIAGPGGARRTLPLTELVVDRRRTALAPNEVVTALSLERPGPRTGETYLKVGRRKAMEVALVGLALRLSLDEAGAVSEARVAVCSVAPVPFRCAEAEAALVGSSPGNGAVADAAELLQAAARPIDDVRGSSAYRRRVLATLLERAVATCAERARA